MATKNGKKINDKKNLGKQSIRNNEITDPSQQTQSAFQTQNGPPSTTNPGMYMTADFQQCEYGAYPSPLIGSGIAPASEKVTSEGKMDTQKTDPSKTVPVKNGAESTSASEPTSPEKKRATAAKPSAKDEDDDDDDCGGFGGDEESPYAW